jgi:hypothetical protein
VLAIRDPPPSAPSADLIDVSQEISRILVNAIGTGTLEFVLTIAAGQEADP